MKKMRVLFVCKHNKFRSKVAEAYFKQINKNKNIIASSAGIIRGNLSSAERKALLVIKEFNINLKEKSQGLSIDLLRKQNLIIIVADDVPKIIFNKKEYINFKTTKIIVWKIPDNPGATSIVKLRKIVPAIMKKVDELNAGLQRRRK